MPAASNVFGGIDDGVAGTFFDLNALQASQTLLSPIAICEARRLLTKYIEIKPQYVEYHSFITIIFEVS
jgi:hypothetical protein